MRRRLGYNTKEVFNYKNLNFMKVRLKTYKEIENDIFEKLTFTQQSPGTTFPDASHTCPWHRDGQT